LLFALFALDVCVLVVPLADVGVEEVDAHSCTPA
jgi:hypothetical protein